MFVEDDEPYLTFLSKEMRDILVILLDSLGEREFRILQLRYWEEMTLKEIGKEVGLKESRVSTILSNTLGKMRLQLERKGITSAY